MVIKERVLRSFWRKKYPWFFVMYIMLVGFLRGVLNQTSPQFAMNMLMIAAFTSYVFLYIFYIYGVKPEEM